MPIEDPKYGNLVKSASSFTIKKRHQNVDSGEVYERDLSTIGEHVVMGDDKKPVFRSGNFIITVSDERTTPMPPMDAPWETAPNGEGMLWTWDDVKDVNVEDDPSITLEIKPDIYDLRSFAYYGSCVELIRASLNHIISTFPGELYASDQKLTYLKGRGTENEEFAQLGDETFSNLVDNPFGLDIHTRYIDDYFAINEPLKYIFANDFYKENYKFFPDDEEKEGFDITEITYEIEGDGCAPYSKMGTVTVNYEGENEGGAVDIEVWKLKGKDVAYLTDSTGWHIRPISEHYNDFKNKLSIFEKTLLSESTLPKYAPTFEIYSETEYGFDAQMQQFPFPLGLGGYNLGVTNIAYTTYVSKLSKIAELYDEYFCDNLYRVMTHEAIQNFDWSFSREKDPTAEGEYNVGGTKFQKILRIIAREFDEIKLYIDAIKDANKVTYNGNANSPDYLLTDLVENQGWVYKHIIPFVEKPFKDFNIYPEIEDDFVVQPYKYDPDTDADGCKDYAIEPVRTHTNAVEYTPNDINNLFSRLLILNSKPIWRKKGTIDAIDSLLSLFGLKNKNWITALNDERVSFRKGEDFVCSNELCADREGYSDFIHGEKNMSQVWDYEIKEGFYSGITKNITSEQRNMWGVFINGRKNISYSEDADLSLTSKTPWRGLLVKEKEREDGTYDLFPWFDKNAENDGKPYYQMFGGWLQNTIKFYNKNKTYEEDGKEKSIAVDDILDDKKYFTETIPNIRGVENIKQMMEIPLYDLNNGDYCYVVDLSKYYLVIDGIAYDLYPYIINDEVVENWYFLNVTIENRAFVLGTQVYSDSIHVTEPSDNEHGFERKIKPIANYSNNTNIKIFINKEHPEWFTLEDDFGNKARNIVFVKPEIFGYSIAEDDFDCNGGMCEKPLPELNAGDVPSHYFKLHNKNFASYLNTLNGSSTNNSMGWNQLSETWEEYKYIKSIEREYEGNNPHTHKIQNDGGGEYLRYFANFFKYAYENELFDLNSIYENYNEEIDLSNYGFDDIIDWESDPSGCTLFDPAQDRKVWTSEKDEDGNYIITMGGEEIDADSIINTKMVEIVFNNCDSTKVNPKLKYINKVVIPYLAQLLPSTLIVKITYQK